MGLGGPFWGAAMMLGTFLIGVLTIVALALLIVCGFSSR